jgi:signal peptidase I
LISNMADDRSKLAQWGRRIVIGRNPKRTLARAAVLVVVSFIVFKFLLLPIRVTGISMIPTYRDGGVTFVNRRAYFHARPKRSDIVAIRIDGKAELLLKRIVGLPGERLSIDRGLVKINDQPLVEPYAGINPTWDLDEVVLGEDEYWVMGDNRSMDQKSHTMQPIKLRDIIGKVVF